MTTEAATELAREIIRIDLHLRDRGLRQTVEQLAALLDQRLAAPGSADADLRHELELVRRDYLAAAAHAESLGSVEERLPDGDDDTKPLWHRAAPPADLAEAVKLAEELAAQEYAAPPYRDVLRIARALVSLAQHAATAP